jgi:hypothetical protein
MELLPALHNGSLLVVIAPHAAQAGMSALAAELALRGPLTVLDGGNRLAPYQITRLLRTKTANIAIPSRRLLIRRAFTCYQMLALLESTSPLRQPYLILDCLSTFYDDHVSDMEARRLLDLCMCHIERLRMPGPVVVSLAPAPLAERAFLLKMVCAAAEWVIVDEPDDYSPLAAQPGLF